VFRDANYQNDCMVLPAMDYLRNPKTYNNPAQMGIPNDSISSIKYRGSYPAMTRFYWDVNLGNGSSSFCLGSASRLPPGAQVWLYSERGGIRLEIEDLGGTNGTFLRQAGRSIWAIGAASARVFQMVTRICGLESIPPEEDRDGMKVIKGCRDIGSDHEVERQVQLFFCAFGMRELHAKLGRPCRSGVVERRAKAGEEVASSEAIGDTPAKMVVLAGGHPVEAAGNAMSQ
jgi:hypothetical protein